MTMYISTLILNHEDSAAVGLKESLNCSAIFTNKLLIKPPPLTNTMFHGALNMVIKDMKISTISLGFNFRIAAVLKRVAISTIYKNLAPFTCLRSTDSVNKFFR